MKLDIDINCIVKRADDLPGQWVSWCPELDVMTQGCHPDHAVAMLEDAINTIVKDDISSWHWQPLDFPDFPEQVVKRVQHPLRRGDKASEDELWQTFNDMVGMRDGELACFVSLDGQTAKSVDVSLTRGTLHIATRSGIATVITSFKHYCFSPML